MNLQEAQAFFEKNTGETCLSFFALPQSGSSRVNFIAETASQKKVVTYNENLRENEAFFYYSDVFSRIGLNTPEVTAIASERNIYIQDYLGSQTLSEVISEEGCSERVKLLVGKTLKKLFELQQKTKGKVDFSKAFEYEEYNHLPVTHDLYYFKNYLADLLELPYHKQRLLEEFKALAEKVETLKPKALMIRDFQARNILVQENEVFFIDYQAAMEGPALYDVVSFLFQAKARFPEEFKHEMLEYFYSFFDAAEHEQLKASLPYLRLLRYMQVLGAYGFRGLIQRKAHFLESIAQGIQNLVSFVETAPEMQQFPEMKGLIAQLALTRTSEKMARLLQP